MSLLLDTHVWIWLVTDEKKLSSKALKVINGKKGDILYISMMSVWEVSKLHEKGKIKFDRPIYKWINGALEYPKLSVIDLSNDICMQSCDLQIKEIVDPIDQLIIATAMEEKLKLVTADEKIRKYSNIKCIW